MCVCVEGGGGFCFSLIRLIKLSLPTFSPHPHAGTHTHTHTERAGGGSSKAKTHERKRAKQSWAPEEEVTLGTSIRSCKCSRRAKNVDHDRYLYTDPPYDHKRSTVPFCPKQTNKKNELILAQGPVSVWSLRHPGRMAAPSAHTDDDIGLGKDSCWCSLL